MSRRKSFLWFLTIYFIQIVCCKLVITDLSTRKDQCKDICNDNYFLLPVVSESNSVCQRGCRLFNIIDAEGNSNTNKSKIACHASCNEAYVSLSYDACVLGCNEMEKKRLMDISSNSFFVYIEQEGQSNIMVVQPELEQFDLDVLTDPGLRNQLDLGYSLEYKIPETHIRTMPINAASDNYGIPSDFNIQSYQPTGDWLDCASRNSGIPRFVLVIAILMAVLIGVWLIFASEKRDAIPTTDVPDLPPTDVEYSAPPKYSLESEKV